MVFRLELPYSEILNIINMKYIDSLTTGYTQPGFSDSSDKFLILKSLFPDGVKVNITTDDIRLRSN